jgi:soluble lytic murein transglycosylase-like protein
MGELLTTHKSFKLILMLKFITKCVVFLVTLAAYSHSIADDLYLDASNADEITITSTMLEGANTVVIADTTPIEQTLTATELTTNNIASQAALPYQNDVIAAAEETKLEPALINAVIAAESKHNRYARSHKGAYGLMQLMPATGQRFGYIKKDSTKQNVMAGSRYLRELLGQFNGDLELALAAYNAGPGAVIKYQNRIPPYKETKQYVPKVLKYYRRFSS